MDSRWHCGRRSFGLRCLGKATGNLGEKEIKKKRNGVKKRKERKKGKERGEGEKEGGRPQVMLGPGEMTQAKVSSIHSFTHPFTHSMNSY